MFSPQKCAPILIAGFLTFASPINLNAAPNTSYNSWLEKYGAWSLIEKQTTESDTPKNLIDRATASFYAGNSQKALDILQSSPALDNATIEIDRLWLGGRINRSLGNSKRALIWFSQAAKLMDTEEMVLKFNREPNLKNMWFDVWRSMFWNYPATPSISKEANTLLLNQSFQQAMTVWPKTFFILNSQNDYKKLQNSPYSFPAKVNKDITDVDRVNVAQAVAASSLNLTSLRNNHISEIKNLDLRSFWTAFFEKMETNENTIAVDYFYNHKIYKPWDFFNSFDFKFINHDNIWVSKSPETGSWKSFEKKLLSMPPDQALDSISKETGSMLLSQNIVSALQNYKLAFYLITDDTEGAQNLWSEIDHKKIPLSLRVASAILFKLPLEEVLTSKDSKSENLELIKTLCSSSGIDYFPSAEISFWNKFDKNLNQSINNYPLDKLLLFTDSYLGYKKANNIHAKRLALLFPSSNIGQNALLHLANIEINNKNLKLGAYYLKQIDIDSINKNTFISWLQTAINYDLAKGKEPEALKAYEKLTSLGGSLDAEKELKLALVIQQKGDLKKAQVILEKIRDKNTSLPPALSAEILFWIAEGEHALGNKDLALDKYLKLAWKYPKENIWATTAMYRASMILEYKGEYLPAKRLLKTVVKNANTKAQKQAAKSRLNSIDKKISKTDEGSKTIDYPF